MKLSHLILTGGILQLGLLIASSLVPGVLDWRNELKKLNPMTRHLVWVHGLFIVLTIIGLGVISLTCATQLADGSALARAVCGFIGLFWLARLAVQLFLFDPRKYLSNLALKAGYHAMTLVFLYLAVVFCLAAIRPEVLP